MSRSRGFCFTLNNYTEQEYEAIINYKDPVYMVVGKEVGEKGTPHLQGYYYFKYAKTVTSFKKEFPKMHFEIAKGTAKQNQKYCSKEGNFIEKGTQPMSQEDKGKKGKEAIAERWALAKAGKFEELPPEQIKTYEYIYAKHIEAKDRDELDNEWIYGDSGCGKSSHVRANYKEFYNKPMSKWWDNYRGEEVVVLDDFAPQHGVFLGYFLKIWADHYSFNAEVKGGMLKIRPKKIIVTSQYRLEDCFEDEKTIEAISRRFKQIHLIKNNLKTASEEII